MTEPPPALTTRDLAVWYGSSAAVRGIDLSLLPGETVALIGETGSGKTSFAHAVAQLLPASTRVEGSIRIGGVELLGLPAEQRRESRGRQVGFVPQDAMAASCARSTASRMRGRAVSKPSPRWEPTWVTTPAAPVRAAKAKHTAKAWVERSRRAGSGPAMLIR